MPHLVAPKSAMLPTGRRPAGEQRSLGAPLPAKGAPLRGPQALARNDMQKTGRCQRVQGRFPTVIARSGATWQSASPAAAQSREQRLRRIRGSATDLPKVVPTGQVSMRGERIATPVCALARNDMQKEGRVRGCKGAPRNDMLKFAACQRLQGRNDMR